MTAPARDRRAGFTLIEVLAALVVVAVVVVVIQRGMVVARMGLARADAVVAAESVARSLMETQLGQAAPVVGVFQGVSDGRAWTIKAEPLDLPFPPPLPPPPSTTRTEARAPAQDAEGKPAAEGESSAPPQPQGVWRPLRVTVSVEAPPGRPVTVETVRLVKAQ